MMRIMTQLGFFDPPEEPATATATWDDALARLLVRPGGARYATSLRSIRSAATGRAMSPGDVASGGFEELARERGWKLTTQALYAAVCCYAGIACQRRVVSRPGPIEGALSWLTVPAEAGDGPGLRSVAWLTAAAAWPASLSRWQALRLDELVITGSGLRVDGRYLPAGGGAWQAWLAYRAGEPALAASGWALCSLRAGRIAGSGPGTTLAPRSLQAALRAHTLRAAALAEERGERPATIALLRSMTYDTFRRAALERGVGPVDRGPGIGRLARAHS